MKRILAACALLVALVGAGCGSSSGSGTSDPAKLAPANTLAYASFELHPQGPEKAGYDAAFGKLLGADPETQIAKGFTDAIKEQGSKLDYDQDVKPWLGDTASVVLTGIAGDHADYAALIASTDNAKAQAAIDKDLQGQSTTSASYRGVDYKKLDNGVVNGVVANFLVAGTDTAFKAVVDADKDGKSLADSQQWHDSVGDSANGKVGLAYLDLKALAQSAVSSLPGYQRILGPLFLGLVQLHPFVATLAANDDSFVLDVSSPGTPQGKGADQGASSALIESLPADSWGAIALPHVGQALTKLVAGLKLNPVIAGEYAKVAATVRQKSGLDIQRDILAGIGDVAGFVRGTSPKTVGGGVVIGARDKAALKRSVLTLPALIASSHQGKARRIGDGFEATSPDMTQPLEVRLAGPGAVATYGRSSLEAALQTGNRLGQTDLYRKATAAVGARPTLFAAFAPIFQLVKSSGNTDAGFAKAEPRLAHLEYAALGARRDKGLDVLRLVVGLR